MRITSSPCMRAWSYQHILIVMIFIFFSSFPAVSLAQQPAATITVLQGNVLISGQTASVGTIVRTGDNIQTQAGGSAILELSDGSTLEFGENTSLDIALLAQEASGARKSIMKLLWGWMRAKLSPGHQQTGSSFDIETPNALIGVKFSQPDIEVSYSEEKAETIGIAHTVELLAKNLLTDEEVLVPVGSSVIITAMGIKIVAGIVGIVGASSSGATGSGTVSAESAGMSTSTKIAIGAGAVAAAGGIPR